MSNTPFPDRPHAKPVGKRPIAAFFGLAWRITLLYVMWPSVSALVWLREHIRLPQWLAGGPRELAVRIWGVVWLASVWVLLWGSITWANIIVGIIIAIAVMALLPLPRVPVEGRLHLLAALNLLVHLVYYFIISSAQVAWAAVRPGGRPLGAVVRVHLAIKSDLVLTLAIDYINLVPGTMVVEIDHLRRVLYIHVFDTRKQSQIDAFCKQMEYVERQFIWAFERDREWHPSPFHGIDDDYHHVPYADRQRARDNQERAARRSLLPWRRSATTNESNADQGGRR